MQVQQPPCADYQSEYRAHSSSNSDIRTLPIVLLLGVGLATVFAVTHRFSALQHQLDIERAKNQAVERTILYLR